MALTRSMLLWASQNRWLRERASRYGFVRKSVRRFMPGETVDTAIAVARELRARNIASVLTHLGENIADQKEAENVTNHYLQVLQLIQKEGLRTEISVKLTQLGLDLSPEFCNVQVRRLLAAEHPERTLWIDMEASGYVEATLAIYRSVLAEYPNAGVCLQAYLHRTPADVEALLPLYPSVRLVKGAYSEPPSVAIQQKPVIDASYLALAKSLLQLQAEGSVRRAALATHDPRLIRQISEFAEAEGISRNEVEVQMLYGIQKAEQERLASGGWKSGVLIAYGDYWYPWFVRRLAERPANVWLLLRNLTAS